MMILKYKLKKQDETAQTALGYGEGARKTGNEPLDSITHREFLD